MDAEREPRRVVGVAASAGGVEALRRFVATLPADFPDALCVVLHIPPTGRSLLAAILDRNCRLPAVEAEDGAVLRPGVIYVAPADRHLLVRADHLQLSRGPKENGVRPAADPLFRSLARAWGERAVAVVLSGALDDGAAGALAVAQAGGRVIVQADAIVSGMPSATLAVTMAAAVVPVDKIAAALAAQTPVEAIPVPTEPDPADSRRPEGPASGFTCPECNGALWELEGDERLRYRCRVGHVYSEDAMIEAQGTAVESALWAALEIMEERAELLRRIADRMERTPRTERRFRQGARDADERAAIIRRVLHSGGPIDLAREVEEATG